MPWVEGLLVPWQLKMKGSLKLLIVITKLLPVAVGNRNQPDLPVQAQSHGLPETSTETKSHKTTVVSCPGMSSGLAGVRCTPTTIRSGRSPARPGTPAGLGCMRKRRQGMAGTCPMPATLRRSFHAVPPCQQICCPVQRRLPGGQLLSPVPDV